MRAKQERPSQIRKERRCRSPVKGGNTKAQCELAYLYYSGKNKYYDSADSYPPDYANAEKWYLEAAGNFDIGAYFPLGVLYQYVMKNPEQAIRWYKKAAEAGNGQAQYELANCYEYGWKYYQSDNFGELPKDYENAEKWYLMAAKNGKERSAWFALGLMYDSMGKPTKQFPH